MNRLISILLFIISLQFSQKVLAQQSFVEGYVVNNQNDTLRGFLKTANQINTQIMFRQSNSSVGLAITYKPGDIKVAYFADNDEFYYSKAVRVNVKPFKEDLSLENDALPKFKDEILFLNLLSKGKINLYQLKGWDDNYHFFVEKGTGKTAELLLIKYIVAKGENAGRLVTVEEYKNQLTDLMEDCSKVNPKNAVYGEKPFTKLIEQYNACMGAAKNNYSKKGEGIKISWTALAGVGFRALNFNGKDAFGTGLLGTDFVSQTPFTTSVTPSFGISLEAYSPRATNPFSAGLDLLFRTNSNMGNMDLLGNRILASISNTTIDGNGFLKYSLKNTALKPYVRAGVSLSYNLRTESALQVTRIDFLTKLYDGELAKNLSNIELGFLGGIGINVQKLRAELYYSSTNRSYVSVNSLKLNSFNIMLGYRLN